MIIQLQPIHLYNLFNASEHVTLDILFIIALFWYLWKFHLFIPKEDMYFFKVARSILCYEQIVHFCPIFFSSIHFCFVLFPTAVSCPSSVYCTVCAVLLPHDDKRPNQHFYYLYYCKECSPRLLPAPRHILRNHSHRNNYIYVSHCKLCRCEETGLCFTATPCMP